MKISNDFLEHYNYMQSIIPELVELENRVKEIKESKQFKRSYNYFHVLYNRGVLQENPSSKNGYKIIIK